MTLPSTAPGFLKTCQLESCQPAAAFAAAIPRCSLTSRRASSPIAKNVAMVRMAQRWLPVHTVTSAYTMGPRMAANLPVTEKNPKNSPCLPRGVNNPRSVRLAD